MKKQALLVSAFLVLTPASAALAVDYRSPEVRVWEMTQSGETERNQDTFVAGASSNENGGTVAVGDVNNDGHDEIIIGAGPGDAPLVTVYNAAGTKLSSFYAYDTSVNIGVNVAVGNLDGEGAEEIVTGTKRGGGPQVRIFDMNGNAKFTPGFFAYDSGFRGGVNVAVGNTDGKKGDEIITGAGSGGGPHVRVFDRYGEYTGLDFFPFEDSYKGGVTVAAVNVDGGRETEIAMAKMSFSTPHVKVYKTNSERSIVGDFMAYDQSFMGGVTLGGGDVDRDGLDEVITAVRGGGGPHVRTFEGHGAVVDSGFLAYEEDYRGGVAVAVGNVDSDSKTEIVTMPMKKIVDGRLDLFKYIEIDLSEQTLRAYRNGVKENEFLVSTGTPGNDTPVGDFEVQRKIPVKDFIALDQNTLSADYYETLENVHNNLQFLPHYYLHEAYWHNNFGNPMSHGCVNISLENSTWVYNWADLGDDVLIRH